MKKMNKFKWTLLFSSLLTLIAGFTCEKYRYYEVRTEPVDCASTSFKSFKSEVEWLTFEEDANYCMNGTIYAYGAVGRRDVARGLIFNSKEKSLCVLSILVVAPIEGIVLKEPFQPIEEARAVWNKISSKEVELNLVNSEPKQISFFKDYCDGK
ncbi:hypothetical protein ACLVWU_08735 [Bdellovibrio sp. HCB290]|uniref:hypothetical protein n=1 Tax=Bdellovibrio sp. HCB290 TaxID=3394356 RepID=UPI0039B3ED1B